MERPSHMFFQRPSSVFRAPFITLAICLQFAGFWLFSHGLSTSIVKIIHPIDLAPMMNKDLPTTSPPPLPPMKPADIPKVPQPSFTTDQPQQTGGAITATTAAAATQTITTPQPAGVDRPAAGITATHTVPPYPPVERRLGNEGTVTLRLTVGTDGAVTAAEIVKSAGREALDQAAHDWIIAHWRYRPALKDGNPAVVQVLASVTYSLKNQ